MLDAKYNVMNYPCNENNKTVPYFSEFSKTKYPKTSDMEDYLAKTIKTFNEAKIEMKNKDF